MGQVYYARRVNDKIGNARTSCGINLRDLCEIWVDENCPRIEDKT